MLTHLVRVPPWNLTCRRSCAETLGIKDDVERNHQLPAVPFNASYPLGTAMSHTVRNAAAMPTAVRVLLVEDESIVATDITQILTALGHHVVGRASTGHQAVKNADTLRPDLILMDIRLRGGIDGITAAELIRRQQSVAIVYLSAFSDAETVARAILTQPMAYLIKPFRDVDVKVAIEVALVRHRAELAVKESEVTARRVSLHDALTGLHNRRGFIAIAEQQLELARSAQLPVLLLYADLDGLKQINDDLGHGMGDIALQDAAEVLTAAFRDADSVARLGGDEFAVLASGPCAGAATRMLERLETKLSESSRLRRRPFELAMSVGSAIRAAHSIEHVDALLARADADMYLAKRSRKQVASVARR